MTHLLALFDVVGVLARRRYQAAERYFSALGLNHTEARLLRLLDREGGTTTQDALSAMLFVDRSNAGRALKGLERLGHIERVKDTGDRRTNRVQITAKGREAVAEIAKLRVEMVRGFFGELTEEEAGKIVGLLRKACPDENDA